MKKYFNNLFTAIFCCLILLPAVSLAQPYRVDKKGALRSSVTGEEVSFFGVNYTTPFAHAYRQQKRMGVDMKRAIDQDVYHFARLGYNAYRIHVWAYEITDGEGNLLSNDHLDLMDWLILPLQLYFK